jgi:hypothetical protein
MVRTEKVNDDSGFIAVDADGVQVAVTGHDMTSGRWFVLSLSDAGEAAGRLIMLAGDQDDARELARQILRHAGITDVVIPDVAA